MVDLQRHVVDAEALAEHALQAPAHGVAVVARPHEHVRGQRREARRDLPDVEVVDLDDARLARQRRPDRLDVDAARGGLEQDVGGRAQQPRSPTGS